MEVDPVSLMFGAPRSGLSTHDLTWRSTPESSAKQIAINFQLTTSHGGRRAVLDDPGLWRSFQLTTSHGGRQVEIVQAQIVYAFQLTTSHGGRPFSYAVGFVAFNFQLTTSHGGRPRAVFL